MVFNKKEYDKQYYKNHKEQIKQQQKQYYENHKEQIKLRQKQYHAKHHEHYKQLSKQYYENHKEQYKQKAKENYLKLHYNLVFNELYNIYNKQNGKCALCHKDISLGLNGEKRTAYIDHNHNNNKVRGLLCRDCNLLIGYLEISKQINPLIIQSIISYIEGD